MSGDTVSPEGKAEPPDRPGPLAIFAHVHYPDIWADISERLAERVTLPFHLVVTTSCLPTSEVVLPRTPALLSSRVLYTENRGRDILPFLHALKAIGNFEIGLKLHTKKSPQRADGAQWRRALIDDLVPSPSGTADIVERIHQDRRIGFVAPTGFSLSVGRWLLVNQGHMQRILTELGRDLGEDDFSHTFFSAGSMFWFRREALAGLTLPSVLAMFEAESGQTDGTVAHAMERVFPVAAARRGYVSLSVSALRDSSPSLSLDALKALAKDHSDQETTFFPGPGLPALPPDQPFRSDAGVAGPGARRWPPLGHLAKVLRRILPGRVFRAIRRAVRALARRVPR